MDRVPMTPEGYEQAKKKLDHLKNVEMPRVQKALGEAREMGDLSENAEFDAAREEMWKLDTMISELETKISLAEIFDPKTMKMDTVAIGATVKVECESHGRHMVVAVADTGMGIAADELDKIFEKFWRSQREDVQNLPGTGLGLATARQIVRLHGGDIAVASTPGEGSRFTVTLPVYEVGEATRAGARSQETVGSAAE